MVAKRRRRYRVFKKRKLTIASVKRIVNKVVKPEMKVVVFHGNDTLLTGYTPALQSQDLYSIFQEQVDVLSGITVGPGRNQRIGNKITLHKLDIEYLGYLCPRDIAVPNATIRCNTAWTRMIVHDKRVFLDQLNFFRAPTTNFIAAHPDRQSSKIHADITRQINSGYPAVINTGTPIIGEGATVKLRTSFSPKRAVTYTTTGVMKEDGDVYSVALLGTMPNMTVNKEYQIACGTLTIKVYFTDD